MRNRRSRASRTRSLHAEQLESRALLAASPITFDSAINQIKIKGTSLDDRASVVAEGADTIRVRFESAGQVTESTFQRSNVSSIDFYGAAGNDRFENATDIPSRALGGTGDDTLIGGSASDNFSGDEGHDDVIGNGGDDLLSGRDGNDLVLGGEGNDELKGGVGDDYLGGGTGNDLLIGNDGDDQLYGDEGNDRLMGLDGNDELSGGTDDDVVEGGAGDDQLFGGQGNDELRGQDGDDSAFGADGNDQIYGGLGADLIVGAAGDDYLVGNEGNDEIRGDDGNDQLYCLDGDDLAFGGRGNDLILGGSGNDQLTGEEGNDELRGDIGNDKLYGLLGDDILTGGSGNDLLWGGDGNDQLMGDEGDDELQGEAGNDRLFGLVGNDRLVGGAGNDYLLGDTGNDRLYGSSGNDELNGQDGDDRLHGQTGNDTLNGGLGNDLLRGGNHNDQLTGHDGDDELYGEEGKDRLAGSEGNDFLNGGLDDDILSGNTGDDMLVGREGNDQLDGDEGNDTLVGDVGGDALKGGSGNDVLIGGDGGDQLYGGWGDDIVIGAATHHDLNTVKLKALAFEWSSAAPYANRVATIESENFIASLIAGETIIDDAVADSVFGEEGQDWYFQSGFMHIYVPPGVHTHHEEDPAHHDDGHLHPGQVVIDHPPDLEGFALISATDMFTDREPTEAISSTLPHADSPVLQREHLTLFESVRYDQVTHYAIHDGAWSNPGTWHSGVVPADGARVLIPLNVEVRVDTAIPARLATIRVDGTLSFDTAADTELRVDTVVVSSSGSFEMGTVAEPIQTNVTARLLITNDGPIDRTIDPFGITRGLLSHGRVSIFGAEVTSYAAIASSAAAGTAAINLKAVPVGWKVGDTIVVASTTAGTEQNEERTIAGIEGNRVVLNQPLSYNHITPGSEIDVHIANVTRNAVIESESQEIDRRGHVMFMHNRNVDIAYAGFYHLGRTNKSEPINDPVVNSDWGLEPDSGTNPRGRYAVHFHRNGLTNDGNPAVIKGSAVVDSPGWGIVNHSSYVDISNNVAYDVHGAAFVTEAGDEIGSFRHNIAIGSVGSGESINSRQLIQDFGHQGDGFWFQGGGISVTDNVSAGNDGHAFAFFTRGLIEGGEQRMFLAENLPYPEIANGAAMIDVEQVPILEFAGNTGYSSETGLATRYQLRDAPHPLQQSLLENSVFWNNSIGINLAYAEKIVLRDVTVVHSPGAWPQSGIKHNAVTKDITFDNVSVAGYSWGIDVPRSGYTIINGGYFANRHDIVVQTGLSADRSVLITGPIQLGALGAENQSHVYMRSNLTPIGDWSGFIFSPDIVTLDYGGYDNQRVYYTMQQTNVVPIPAPLPYLSGDYVGLTNQQLWDQFGIALGGEIATGNAYTIPRIIGLIAP